MQNNQLPAVGIDLGTTFSVIAALDQFGNPQTIVNAEGDPWTPSVVLFEDDGVTVGKEAKAAAPLEPQGVAQHGTAAKRVTAAVVQRLIRLVQLTVVEDKFLRHGR